MVTRGNDGYLVRLKDVAALERGAENERTELHYNGISSIGLGICQTINANTLDVIRGVKGKWKNQNDFAQRYYHGNRF